MQSSTPFALCRLLGGGEGAAVVGGGLLSRVEQLSLGEAVGPGDRPGLCRGILGVLRSVEGGCRNVVPGRKCPYNLDRLTDPTRSRHAANPPKIMFGSRNPLGLALCTRKRLSQIIRRVAFDSRNEGGQKCRRMYKPVCTTPEWLKALV